MADNKVRRYAFFTQPFKIFKLRRFQAAGIADKLADGDSP